ncbi:MAG: hypothetical protein MUC84_05265 [Solirubrobacteraceae bacterium]|jgi:hypothetical protein|nr:hypothetical protein [Solirubrobacteraceae bacterium]
MTPLAHTGHWYHTLLYVAPVVLIAAGLWWSGRREARERAAREAARREREAAPTSTP